MSQSQTMIARAAILSLIVFLSPALCAAQKQARLTKIEVIGLKRLKPEQVIASSQLEIGQAIDHEDSVGYAGASETRGERAKQQSGPDYCGRATAFTR